MTKYLNDVCEECLEEHNNGFIIEIIAYRTDKKGCTHYGCRHQKKEVRK